jgi:glycosyltransferase involved in cell wall biosynthesis
MAQSNKPMVSVSMITYKHEAYIKQAIEGVLMQETDFDVDLIIADDCSPDKTSAVVNEIIKTHPNGFRIKYFRHDTNIGMQANGQFATEKCVGKYLAVCEGDDYWTDPLKLQKQVDFLESYLDYGYCTHRYKIYDEVTGLFQHQLHPISYKTSYVLLKGMVIDKINYHKYWATQPLTALVRKDLLNEVLNLANIFSKFRDHHIFYLLLNYGKGICLEFDGGVYRVHDGGIHSGIGIIERNLTCLTIYEELYYYSKDKGFLRPHVSSSLYLIYKGETKFLLHQTLISNLKFKHKAYYFYSCITSFFLILKNKIVD